MPRDRPSANFVWTLIEDGKLNALMGLAPPDFDWRALSPKKRTPLLEAIVGQLARDQSLHGLAEHLKLLDWLLEHGADPHQEAGDTDYSFLHTRWTSGGDEVKFEVHYKGKSAIDVVVQLLHKFETSRKGREDTDEEAMEREEGESCEEWEDDAEVKAANADEIKFLTQVLDLFAKVESPTAQADKVLVDVSVLELWERVRGASSEHDLTFQTADGNIKANSHVLTQASPVLAAMLSSGMREGHQRRIEVKDATCKGMEFFLDLLYTGASSSNVDSSVALVALDMAHRWQVGGVVAMIVNALAGMLSDEMFEAIAEAAALKGISTLIASCVRFAAKSTSVQRRVKDGSLPDNVLKILGKPAACPAVKKRRMF